MLPYMIGRYILRPCIPNIDWSNGKEAIMGAYPDSHSFVRHVFATDHGSCTLGRSLLLLRPIAPSKNRFPKTRSRFQGMTEPDSSARQECNLKVCCNKRSQAETPSLTGRLDSPRCEHAVTHLSHTSRSCSHSRHRIPHR